MPIRGLSAAPGAEPAIVPDAAQRAVLALPPGASAVVLGAPGTGKTATALELVAHRVRECGLDPDEVMVLAATRASATRLRDRIARRIGLPSTGPLARTPASLQFEIVAARARRLGLEPPRLVSGAEQDADIAQLLAGHVEDGTGPRWPEPIDEAVRALPAFRAELRDLLARAAEHGVDTRALRALGERSGRPAWCAAAEFAEEYRAVVTAARPDQLDGAELAANAVAAVRAGEAGPRAEGLRLLVVDDLQEATRSTVELLAAFAARGVAVVAFGDPDVASNGFRGGEPERLGRLGAELGGGAWAGVGTGAGAWAAGAETLLLDTVHRHGPELRALVARVTGRIGTAGAGRQRAALASASGADAADPGPAPSSGSAPGPAAVATIVAPSPAREVAAIARELRAAHLERGVPWSELAVVVRSRAAVESLRRALALHEVPARAPGVGRPLREHRAARALLDLVDAGIRLAPLDVGRATALLTGPFGGLDRLALRRLRLALRAEELAGGGSRGADALLVEALGDPVRLATIDHRAARRAARLAGTLRALAEAAAGGASAEELLWLVWERSGLAERWYQQALGSGIAAAEADDALDGVVAVFAAARRFVELAPSAPPGAFLASVLDAAVSDDRLAPAAAGDCVTVTTPAGAVGLAADTVVVAGLQEGVWPNLRPRGSLLAPQQLAGCAAGVAVEAGAPVIDERRLVLEDELRQFALAVSRARRRVVLSAVESEDAAPSPLLAFAAGEGVERIDAATLPPLTLRGMTGRLRRQLTVPWTSGAERAAAASGLAQLARAGVPGADPADWHGLRAPSTRVPLYLPEETVPVSPSALGEVESSPLDWFIRSVAGSEAPVHLGLGTIVHWALETSADHSADGLLAAIESRWGELVFESPWLSERYRRMARTFAAGLAEYLADRRAEGAEVVGAERHFELELGRARIRGSIDRVERERDGRVVIVDLKTGAPAPAATIPEHPQLGAYQLAYAMGALDEALAPFGEHAPGGARLLWVKEGSRSRGYRLDEQEPFDAERIERFRQRIDAAVLAMAAAEFHGLVEPSDRGGPPGWELLLHRVGPVSG
ncbi:MAG: PD-(D/E)XK nuclease family protein [Microbacteriaceae bacterium]